MLYNLFSHLLNEGHLGSFWLQFIITKLLRALAFLQEHQFSLLWDRCPRVQLLDYMGIPLLWLYHFTALLTHISKPVLHTHQHLVLSLFSGLATLISLWCYFAFPWWQMILGISSCSHLHIYMSPLVKAYSCFGAILIESFVFQFYCWSLRFFIYYIHTDIHRSPLLNLWFANAFSQYVVCLFISFTLSFIQQKNFSFWFCPAFLFFLFETCYIKVLGQHHPQRVETTVLWSCFHNCNRERSGIPIP